MIGSLQNMMRAIGRVIRQRQEDRIRESMGLNLVPFDIMTDPRFADVRNAGTEAAKESSRSGLGKEYTSSDILTREEEALMLASPGCSLATPKGINSRFVYLSCRNLFIRGMVELRLTYKNQFELHSDNDGVEFLRYV